MNKVVMYRSGFSLMTILTTVIVFCLVVGGLSAAGADANGKYLPIAYILFGIALAVITIHVLWSRHRRKPLLIVTPSGLELSHKKLSHVFRGSQSRIRFAYDEPEATAKQSIKDRVADAGMSIGLSTTFEIMLGDAHWFSLAWGSDERTEWFYCLSDNEHTVYIDAFSLRGKRHRQRILKLIQQAGLHELPPIAVERDDVTVYR